MSGVQTETTYDAGGGKDVGWIDNGDWMDYSINPATAGTYTVNLRIATEMTGAQLQFRKSNGTVLATVTIPNTAGYQTWRTITTTLTLPAGLQTIRVVSLNASMWNINWMDFIPGTGGVANRGTSLAIASADAPGLAEVSVYPNPATDRVKVQLNNTHTGNVRIQLIRMDGTLVRQVSAVKQSALLQSDINIGDLPRGSYMLRMTVGGWTESRQIIKQ